MIPDPRDAYRLASTSAARVPYRHTEHVSTEPTRAQRIGRRLAAVVVGIAFVAALGAAGSADVDRACESANLATSDVCAP